MCDPAAGSTRSHRAVGMGFLPRLAGRDGKGCALWPARLPVLPAARTDILLGAACALESASVGGGEAAFGPVVMRTSRKGLLLTLRRPEAALALMDGAVPPPRAGREAKQSPARCLGTPVAPGAMDAAPAQEQ